MALDQQRNWDISMAENLEQVRRSRRSGWQSQKNAANTNENVAEEIPVWRTPPIYLPDEILSHILSYVCRFRESQTTLASCCLLSRQWYSVAIAPLYECPHLYGNHFQLFARTIVPSLNLHIRESSLAALIKILDMRALVHQADKRITGRLLSRTKDNLEAFIAPVVGFGWNSLASLAKCQQLRLLDLSLISESPPLGDLLIKVSKLENLTTFNLPRSSGFGGQGASVSAVWPPKLENLSLSGGIDGLFLHGIVAFPSTLRSLNIEHCPMAKGSAVMRLLRTSLRPLPNLEALRLAHLPRLHPSSLDDVLFVLPRLSRLSISVDYITPFMFDFTIQSHFEGEHSSLFVFHEGRSADLTSGTGEPSALRTLELTNSGNPGVEDKVSPIDLLIALDDGNLPYLSQVRVAKSLLWHANETADDVEALADALQDSAVKRGDAARSQIGVWTFEG